MVVYFLPGMCVNCKVFDKIELPYGYEKKYIDWHIPRDDESLEEYTKTMAMSINTSEPFILVGYSLGGIIMQEMNHFLKPVKNILISSMKNTSEAPTLFRFAKKIHFGSIVPKALFTTNKTISNIFAKLVYDMPIELIEECVTYTSSTYIKWATHHITIWKPTLVCNNLYHIHGTKDQIFPSNKIKNAYLIEGGDHLIIIKKSDEVNDLIKNILIGSK